MKLHYMLFAAILAGTVATTEAIVTTYSGRTKKDSGRLSDRLSGAESEFETTRMMGTEKMPLREHEGIYTALTAFTKKASKEDIEQLANYLSHYQSWSGKATTPPGKSLQEFVENNPHVTSIVEDIKNNAEQQFIGEPESASQPTFGRGRLTQNGIEYYENIIKFLDQAAAQK